MSKQPPQKKDTTMSKPTVVITEDALTQLVEDQKIHLLTSGDVVYRVRYNNLTNWLDQLNRN